MQEGAQVASSLPSVRLSLLTDRPDNGPSRLTKPQAGSIFLVWKNPLEVHATLRLADLSSDLHSFTGLG